MGGRESGESVNGEDGGNHGRSNECGNERSTDGNEEFEEKGKKDDEVRSRAAEGGSR